MATLEQPIEKFPSVQVWRESYQSFWGERLPQEALQTLQRFCAMIGEDPDSMVNACLRPQGEGSRFLLSTRARRRYMEQIDAFEHQERSRERANFVRSFFIHNGVAMNPPILR